MTTKIYNAIVTTKHVLSHIEYGYLMAKMCDSYQWDFEFHETCDYPVKHDRFSFVIKDLGARAYWTNMERYDEFEDINDDEEVDYCCLVEDDFTNMDIGITDDEIMLEFYCAEDSENPEFKKVSSIGVLINNEICVRDDIDENDFFEDELASIAFHSKKAA